MLSDVGRESHRDRDRDRCKHDYENNIHYILLVYKHSHRDYHAHGEFPSGRRGGRDAPGAYAHLREKTTYAHICIHMCIYIYIYTYAYLSLSLSLSISLSLSLSVHTHIYIYIYTLYTHSFPGAGPRAPRGPPGDEQDGGPISHHQ